MPDSILERITKDIEAALKTVTKADGYSHDFTVRRRSWGGDAPTNEDVLCIIHQGQPIQLDGNGTDEMLWDQPYGIDLFVTPDESQERTPDELINSARADAEKALAYTAESCGRSGLAAHEGATTVLAPVLFTDGPNHGIQVRIVVRYGTVWNDPLTSNHSNIS